MNHSDHHQLIIGSQFVRYVYLDVWLDICTARLDRPSNRLCTIESFWRRPDENLWVAGKLDRSHMRV